MKKVGTYNGINIYSDPSVPPDVVYMLNPDMQFELPKRKDGKPDMRYRVNKLERILQQARKL